MTLAPPPVQFLGHLDVTTKHCPLEIDRFHALPPAFGRHGGVRHAKAGIRLVPGPEAGPE